MVRVLLKTNVHCSGCEKKIRKFLWKMDGVTYVWLSYQTNEVEVRGSVDAEEVRTRLETKLRKSVIIESSGVAEDAPAPARRAPSPAPRTPTPPTSPLRYQSRRSSPPNYQPPPPPQSNDGYYYPPSNGGNYYYPAPPPPPSNDGYYYPPSNSNYYYPAPPPPPSNDGYYYPPSNDGYHYHPYGSDGSLATFSDENPDACSIQ